MPAVPIPAASYDVLLYAKADSRYGVENRWFIAGSFHSRPAARLEFQLLCQEFPSERVILLLVASIHDPETGRFRDHVLDSRNPAPLIDHKRLRKLTPEKRELISRAVTQRARVPRPPPAPAEAGPIWWIMAGGGLAATAAAMFVLAG